jgi:carboxyl-terminal processing protease
MFPHPYRIAGARSLLTLALAAGTLLASSAQALIEATEAQRETAAELIEQLEERHYAKLTYDRALASQHLDAYVDSLDAGKMFFTTADLAAFDAYRDSMAEALPRGELDGGFAIFNRFHEVLLQRLEHVVAHLPALVEAMDFSVDETFVLDGEDRQWARSREELDDRWRKHLKNQVLSLRLADKPEDEIIKTLARRYRNQLTRVKQYNAQDAFQIYANALTELYDPHTNYLSPRRSENFNINMRLSLEGIGAVLQIEDEYTKVARLLPAGPADKGGELQPSDRIVAVAQGEDGEFEDVIGWRLDEVVELIRGPKGTTVRLQVLADNAASDAERKTISIVRNRVKLEEQSAQKRILELPRSDGDTVKVGVIDIPTFYIDFQAMRRGDDDYKSTTRDVSRLLDELQAEGVDGIIVDLRNNGGGSLQEANELTGLFIEYGPTVQIRHASRRVWRDGKRLRSAYYDGPLMVLINRLSASASEIFAGAIQDYDRGLIVGDRSYGKGTVQTMVPLTEGQLKITESKFYRISGDSTQHRGVVPDIVFPSLYDSAEIGESALEHALDWDQITPVRHRRYSNVDALVPQLEAMYRERSAENPEFRYLKDQLAIAEDNRDIREVSLNEDVRRAEREVREARSLAIENARRLALGLAKVASLEELDDVESEEELAATTPRTQDGGSGSTDQAVAASTGDAVAVIDVETLRHDDVLLAEAGNILVDALLMQKQAYALNTPDDE